ncbi:helix-turn-helix domain-containing protein [Robertkochia solimangrovi]|uniref:helix-turn-helix domain-containing protein n=1 Tax=Robertkochia solimangrovi TaxID=2213046 RepID=UPI00118171B9|nr:helix-turn-helix transcriptional regulator [Robertkochia solimangrovi]TRZ45280.1 AraC family transcriptional regulator [Robertkochia solimangrovi]
MSKLEKKKASGTGQQEQQLKGFKVYEIGSKICSVPNYSRRDFYKICMNTGENRIHYANRGIETTGSILFFGNPYIPYSWEVISSDYNGYACVFTEDFLKISDRSESVQDSPLFKIGGTPIFQIDEEQRIFLTSLFKKMLDEQNGDYHYKDEFIRNSIGLIIHEAMKMEPSDQYFKHRNASSRITSLFMELLERQFPIDNLTQPLAIRTPKDFANNLSIHVNHLNRSVKEITGRSTSELITERIITEAKALLQHTDWSISDIAYALGFEYATYFNNYFKKATGNTPRAARLDLA